MPPPVEDMPLIRDWLRGRLEDDALTDLAPGRTIAPPSERRAALSLLAQLSADGNDGLCHGDVSAPNVLVGEAGRLLVVDPRGFAGDVAYDVAVAALKATIRGAPRSVASDLADRVGVDLGRVRAWMIVADVARV
jgi:streptomycin 6-kinase